MNAYDLPPYFSLLHAQVEVPHVQKDKRSDPFREFFGRFQSAEDVGGNARTLLGVRVKVPVPQIAEGLSDIVQKCRPANGCGCIIYTSERVFEHVVVMEICALRHAVTQGELGHDLSEHARVAQDVQPAPRTPCPARFFVGQEKLIELGENALGRNVADERAVLFCSCKAFFVGGKTCLCRKARKPDKP